MFNIGKKMFIGALTLVCLPSWSIMSSTTVANAATMQENSHKVQAVHSSGSRVYSSVSKATIGYEFDYDLDVPDDLTAKTKSDTKISLDWDSVSGARSYYVYRATSYSGTYSKIATVTTSSYTDYNLSYNKTYYYKIKAHNSRYTSNYSSIVHTTTAKDYDSDLDEPGDLTAKSKSDSKISLDWDSVSGATSYYVYRATSYSGTYSKIATVTTSSYTDYNLSYNKTYYYKIKAHNSSDTSNYSSSVHATTASDYDSDLNVPKSLTAEAKSDSKISLDWASISGATSYYVYRATSYSGTYSKIATVATSSYTDYSLSYNKTYYYKVKAHNSNYTSDYSSIVHATTDED